MNIETLKTELEEKKAMLPSIVLYDNRERLKREIVSLATEIVDYNIMKTFKGEKDEKV